MIRRLPARDDELWCPFRVGAVYQRKLPGLSGRPSFRVTAEPRRQRLGEVTHREVVADEGFDGRRALERWRLEWVRRHDAGWMSRHRTASDEEILRRWRMKHAQAWCWVVVLDLMDPVRCMAEQRDILSGRTLHSLASGESEQYVTSGGIDPYAEAVDPHELVRLVAATLEARAEAGLTRQQRRALRRRQLFGPHERA